MLIFIQLGCLLSLWAFLRICRARTTRGFRAGWLIQFLAMPFWLAATARADQWGMFTVAVVMLLVTVNSFLRFHFQALHERAVYRRAGL